MKKKSIRTAAQEFATQTDEIIAFANAMRASGLSDKHLSWGYDLAAIRLYREFENFVLSCLVALINNDSATFADKTGVGFPKHMNVDVCEFLVVGNGYFDFKGRQGLISKLKQFLPTDHWLVAAVKAQRYTQALERLCTLRNFAAHDSTVSKKAALKAIGQKRMSSAGAWLKLQGRFVVIADRLKELANEIEQTAPH